MKITNEIRIAGFRPNLSEKAPMIGEAINCKKENKEPKNPTKNKTKINQYHGSCIKDSVNITHLQIKLSCICPEHPGCVGNKPLWLEATETVRSSRCSCRAPSGLAGVAGSW